MTQTYIPIPFGQDADDLTNIPFETVDDGSVSYQQGFGPRYQLKLRVNPSALPFPRGQFNQLMLTMTQNQQSWMQYGLPLWTDPEDNLGDPLAYPINAEVYHEGNTYQSLIADNESEPGTDSTWLVTSGAQDGVQVGMSIPWNTIGAPTGRYLLEDGSAVSRTTYADLFNKLCPLNSGTTTNGSDLITNLANTTVEYHIGMKVEGAGITPGAQVIAIPNSTSVQTNTTATVTADNVAVRFFVWGPGDGINTFNIPTSTDHYIAGAGGSGITWSGNTYNKVGQSFGEANYQLVKDNLPEHGHDFLLYSGQPTYTGRKSDDGGPAGSTNVGTAETDPRTGGITGGTTNDPIPQIPPTKMKKWFIRY